MVFHSPQPSHFPAQRLCTVPQFWQMNWVFAFAIRSSFPQAIWDQFRQNGTNAESCA
jgi:hypothetical protein